MFVEMAAPQITPIACFSDFCGDPVGGPIYVSSVWTILIAGALIMPRWRDMFLVAAVALALVFILEYMRHDFPSPPDGFWRQFAFSYAGLLLYATALHAIKRGVVWLAVRLRT